MQGLIISVIVLLAVFGQHNWLSASAERSLKDGQQNADLKASPLKLLDTAVRLAEREHHSAIKAELLSSLAIVYLRLGEKKKGEDLLARSRQLIEEEDDLSKDCYECPNKEFFRILIAIDHAQAGQTDRAQDMLEQIVRMTKEESGNRSGQLLAGLGTVFAGIGNKKRGLQLLSEAFEMSKSIGDSIDKTIALEEIAERYAAVDQVELAARIAQSMEKGPFKDHALISISKKYAERGQIDHALKMNDEVDTTNFKPDILIFVAKQLLKRREKEKALELLHKAVSASVKITAENLKQFARSDAAQLLAEAGDFDETLRILQATEAPGPRVTLLAQLAPLFANARHLQSADKLLSEAYQLTSPRKRWAFEMHGLLEVAEAYAAVGKKDRALQLLTEASAGLDTLTEPFDRESILSEIAATYLKLGETAKAIQISEREQQDGIGKLLTLLEIASKLAGAQQLMEEKDKTVRQLMRP